MLFSEFYKIMVNKVTFVAFRGAIAPIAPLWIRPCFGFLLSAALQFTPISKPTLIRNDVHHNKDAPSLLSLRNGTLQRKDALHHSHRYSRRVSRRTAAYHHFHQSHGALMRVPYGQQ